MVNDTKMYMDILSQYLKGFVWVMIICFVVFTGTLLFHIIRKNKTYSILTVLFFAMFFVFNIFIMNDAIHDYKNESITIGTGTIQHNVSDSYFYEDITFYPSDSNESICIQDNIFTDVDCPFGEYSATIVYAEKSKILLYVNVQSSQSGDG